MRKISVLAFVGIAVLLGCFINVQAYVMRRVEPSVKLTNPKNNSVNIKVNSAITITFQRPIKKGKTFNSISFKLPNGKPEKVSLGIKGNVLSIKPVKPMSYASFYAVNIPQKALVDSSGAVLSKAIAIKFKTENKPVKVVPKPGTNPPAQSGQIPKPDNPAQTTSSAVTTSGSGVSADPTSGRSLMLHAFYSGNTKFTNDTERYLKGLNSVSFMWSSLKINNGEVLIDDSDKNTDFHKPDDYSQALSVCKASNIPAQIAIYSDGNTAKAVISNDDSRSTLIEKIVSSLKMNMPDGQIFEFGGVVIDFEGFRQSDTAGYFDTFLSELKTKLDVMDKKLYVAVNVRGYWPGYNYSNILKYADKVILMAHDYEPSDNLTKGDVLKYTNYDINNPIYTMAPIGRVQSDLEDMISCVNSLGDKKKILLQLSFGLSQWQFAASTEADWSSLGNDALGKKVTPTYDMLLSRIYNRDGYGINITNGYIKELESPYLTYFNTSSKTFNFMIYEDARSIKSKIDLSKFEGIDGISLWRLGNIPDDNSDTSKKYYLNVWDTILNNVK